MAFWAMTGTGTPLRCNRSIVIIAGRPLLEKREKWRTPKLFRSMLRDKPELCFPVEVALCQWILCDDGHFTVIFILAGRPD
jgi:hypothetical protein